MGHEKEKGKTNAKATKKTLSALPTLPPMWNMIDFNLGPSGPLARH